MDFYDIGDGLTMGRHSYGRPIVRWYYGDAASVRIGDFVSIADDVVMTIGGSHPTDWVSTFPFRVQFQLSGAFKDGMPETRGDIVVGSDVWIARGARILSGVHIGDGAVVGAYAVVGSDVRPYAIVAGNPAREIRRRFSDEQVARLLRIRWWDWPDEQVKDAIPLLSSDGVEDFLDRYDRSDDDAPPPHEEPRPGNPGSGPGPQPPTQLERALRGAWRVARTTAPRPLIDAIAGSRIPRAIVPALLTARPARFAACELRGRMRLAQHRLRGAQWTFCVHHGSWDASVLAEVFRAGYYVLPPAVEEHFQAMDRPLRVIDLGAHVGLFGLWVLKDFPSADIVAFEPDPLNFAALTCTIRTNGLRTNRWHAIQACAARADGERAFAAGGSSSAHLLADGCEEGVKVAARDVFRYLDQVDLLKIDIEGGEWELLGDSRFSEVSPSLLFLEYHPYLCPAPDPRAHAIGLLRRSGYRVVEIFRSSGAVGLVRATRTTPRSDIDSSA